MSHELEHEYGESVRPAEEIVVELPKNETLIPVEEVVYRELPQTGSPLFLIGIALILAGVMIKRLYHFKWSK